MRIPGKCAGEPDRHAERFIRCARPQQPFEGQADVAALLRQPLEPLAPIRARRLFGCVLAVAQVARVPRSSGARSTRSASRSDANSRTVSSIPSRGCASRPESVRRERALVQGDETIASRPQSRSPSHTASIASSEALLRRPSAGQQHLLGLFKGFPGPFERRAHHWRTGRSRGPPLNSSSRCSSRSSSAGSSSNRARSATNSIASGRPSRRAQIASTSAGSSSSSRSARAALAAR